ncbi:glycerol kinase GlpK [Sanyastnella coralliicola]|uniref:glycerol kinase GlpK n=1 Tax=Sanyastnella coralliicola TaxID=3069118 RepID=UPI0027B893A0|nr:glycerol kinase GlpK [Longitalea sp. SCSIO 12813]
MILTIDQGTTSCRSLLVSSKGEVMAVAQEEFTQFFPHQGWVEHDADEIWETQLRTIQAVFEKAKVSPKEIMGIGITNQRETTVAWDKTTSKPICKAIVWQDKRTAAICEDIKIKGLGERVRERTGLVVDAYFSASKMMWILSEVPGARELANQGKLLLGTIDSWLMWKLSEGELFATDVSNASRTMLFDIHSLEYDEVLLTEFDIPRSALAEVKPSIGTFGYANILGERIPITGVAGDQQCALFGQACFEKGMVKNTYGTGCFMLMNTGTTCHQSKHGLLSTIAWANGEKTVYALEGSVFIAGAAVQWLRDGLEIIENAADSEEFAEQAEYKEHVYVVPAFVGLGAPYWDMYARGAVFGLTRDTGKNEIVRATLESMAFQTRDVLDAMSEDAGLKITKLRVDGGASANDLLMQFQADIITTEVDRPANVESTALGAAYMAGIGCGLWQQSEIKQLRRSNRVFKPLMEQKRVDRIYKGWKKAVERSMQWIDHEP